MDTLKTAVVVVLLMAVLYGAWVVLNGEPNQQPYMPGAGNWQASTEPNGGPQVEIAGGAFTGTELPNEAATVQANQQQQFAPGNLGGNNAIAPGPVGLNPAAASPQTGGPLNPPPSFNGDSFNGDSFNGDSFKNNTSPGLAPPTNELGLAPPIGFPELGNTSTDPTSPQFGLQNSNSAANTLATNDFSNSNDPISASPNVAATNPDRGNGSIGASNQLTDDPQWTSAMAQIQASLWREALFTLSLMYQREDLDAQRRQEVVQLLNPLAAKVIYSREHLMEPAYRVVGNESLQAIAEQFKVPWQLLANINGIQDPTVVLQGTELKVMRGPFRAEVNLTQGNAGQLTLFAGRLYAGQFDVTSGQDPAPSAGEFQVQRKEPGKNYFVQGGQTIPAGHASNPYGSVYIDLGQLSIHGSSLQASFDTVNLGCISLSPKDAEDVYGILSRGSTVLIRR
ncbi:MAG: hypothetical protein ACI9G1_001134 [Pirellulaceae bacterium]